VDVLHTTHLVRSLGRRAHLES